MSAPAGSRSPAPTCSTSSTPSPAAGRYGGAVDRLPRRQQRHRVTASAGQGGRLARLLGADVIGYMEMENDGYGPTAPCRRSSTRLNAADGAGHLGVRRSRRRTGVVDAAGVGLLIKAGCSTTASVPPVGPARPSPAATICERRPVAQTFQTPAGARFTVIANHFKSKGSCPTSGPDTDQGDGQGCWNVHRTAQASGWRAGSAPTAGRRRSDVLIVGDLNSYAGEDPIRRWRRPGTPTWSRPSTATRRTPTCSTASGATSTTCLALELAAPAGDRSRGRAPQRRRAVGARLQHRVQVAGQIASLYAPDRFRTSDHDPLVVGLFHMTSTGSARQFDIGGMTNVVQGTRPVAGQVDGHRRRGTVADAADVAKHWPEHRRGSDPAPTLGRVETRPTLRRPHLGSREQPLRVH